MDIKIGSRVPAFCTAFGKVLLAHLNESELMELLRVQRFSCWPKRTITSAALLNDNLLQVREQGYAIDDEELLEGVRCIATPIRNYSGRVVGALSISGPSVRMSYEKLGQLKDPLVNTAREISKKLGNPNAD
jgi:DNA-binding IclR family transcriptional regulator